MNIVVVGLGFVGVSYMALLAKKHSVVGVDISQDKVEKINCGAMPMELSEEISGGHFTATTSLETAIRTANCAILCLPTDLDVDNTLNTNILDDVLRDIACINPNIFIVIKSTVPIGYTRAAKDKYNLSNLFFSPEFLRESNAIFDVEHPSRIVFGYDKGCDSSIEICKEIAQVFTDVISEKNCPLIFTSYDEAESIKLFSNAYLALRVAFFNEIDSFSIANSLSIEHIIKGVCLDKRIGDYYNNPSFGYGGYCLPKDVHQLAVTMNSLFSSLIESCIESNAKRKDFIYDKIMCAWNLNNSQNGYLGVFIADSLTNNSTRGCVILEIAVRLVNSGIPVIVYSKDGIAFAPHNFTVIDDLFEFKRITKMIIADRITLDLADVEKKVFSRDIHSML